ncbi:MAG: NAD-binding protein [Bacilli bacterium]|nr:NAD-binding protein [Bacilli bacterium]
MKIVIAGGSNTADYIIKNFKGHSHQLTIINFDREAANYLAKSSKLPVFYGDPTKPYCLKDAHIEGSDIFIALGNRDCDNYVSCLLAKKVFNVKKCICICSNPKNVEVFKQLGIDSVISSTEQLVQSILSESSLESLIKTMSLEDEKIVLTEIIIKSTYYIAHKHIMEINFPKTGSIACIYRRPRVIIPNGSTLILPKDKLIVLSTPNDQKSIIDFVQKTKK